MLRVFNNTARYVDQGGNKVLYFNQKFLFVSFCLQQLVLGAPVAEQLRFSCLPPL
jgi:hypothetical protein